MNRCCGSLWAPNYVVLFWSTYTHCRMMGWWGAVVWKSCFWPFSLGKAQGANAVPPTSQTVSQQIHLGSHRSPQLCVFSANWPVGAPWACLRTRSTASAAYSQQACLWLRALFCQTFLRLYKQRMGAPWKLLKKGAAVGLQKGLSKGTSPKWPRLQTFPRKGRMKSPHYGLVTPPP